MTTLIQKAAIGTALVASALTAAAPAEARSYYRYGRHHGGDDAAIAIAAGIAGLAIGAAISDNNRGRYYDRGYYYDSYPRYRGYYSYPSYYYNSYPDYYYQDYRYRDRYRDRYRRSYRYGW